MRRGYYPNPPVAHCAILAGIRLSFDLIRAGEWWEYKLVPILSASYATALLLRVPITSIATVLLVLLASMVPGAVYVSVINDVTDADDDARAGKRNRAAQRSRATIALVLAASIGGGLVFCWLWRHDPPLLGCYLAAWLAFSLYSLPPFRLKSRGLAGLVCDASGAHLFPTLVAVLLTFRGAHRPVAVWWIAAVGVWAFTYGIRGILWHQLGDVEADRASGVRTFASLHARAAAAGGTFIAFPIECIALVAMLVQLREPLPFVALAVDAAVAWTRVRLWATRAVIVVPKPRFFIVQHEFYDVFYPLALLVASAIRFPRDAIVIVVHFTLFPILAWRTARDLGRIPRTFYERLHR